MDDAKRRRKKYPPDSANPINRLFIWWVRQFGKKLDQSVTNDDFLYPPSCDESELLADRLERAWHQELEKSRHSELKKDASKSKGKNLAYRASLKRVLFRTFFWDNLVNASLCLLLLVVLRPIQPVLMSWIIAYFNNKTGMPKLEAIAYAGVLILTMLASAFTLHHSFYLGHCVGMRVRIACCSLIYRKVLRLNKENINNAIVGKVVNLMSNDVMRFDVFLVYLNHTWISPIQIVVIGFLMWESVGLATACGIGIMIISAVPMQLAILKVNQMLRLKAALQTDRRVQIMNEVITGIKVIKMYAWEKAFQKMLEKIRVFEMKPIITSSLLRTYSVSGMSFILRIAIYVTLVVFVLKGGGLSAELSFKMVACLDILQMTVVNFSSHVTKNWTETMMSIKRIEEFLMSQERDESNIHIIDWPYSEPVPTVAETNPIRIDVCNVFANWTVGQMPPTLQDVTITVRAGTLCAITGCVGSGKTSILNLLLRELRPGFGSIMLRQKNVNDDEAQITSNSGYYKDNANLQISYASQDHWIFSATVKENILFNQSFKADRYNEVIHVCALQRDLDQLSNGDLTVIGENGVTLSGGQRARINLARAIYKEAGLYLLDDPLNAVDPQVANHIFEKCILQFLQGKTVVLVTHQLQFIKRADNIVFVDRGTVPYQGTYDEFNCNNFPLVSSQSFCENESEHSEIFSEIPLRQNYDDNVNPRISIAVSYDKKGLKFADEKEPPSNVAIHRVFYSYLRMGGNWPKLTLLVMLLILAQVFLNGSDYWVSYWTNVEQERSENSKHPQNRQHWNFLNGTFFSSIFRPDPQGFLSSADAIYVYTFLAGCCVIFCILRSYMVTYICIIANKNIHNYILSKVLHTTIDFFTSQTSGRILNRFSNDMGDIDTNLLWPLVESASVITLLLGSFTLTVIVNHYMILNVALVIVLFYFVIPYYGRMIQKCKHLECSRKSPLFTHVNATLHGLTTIRSNSESMISMCVTKFDEFQNVHTSAWYLLVSLLTACSIMVDTISNLFIACVVTSLFILDIENVPGVSVGLVLTQMLLLQRLLQGEVRIMIELFSKLISVERVLQYQNLPDEHSSTMTKQQLPSNWPDKGHMIFRNVSLSYGKDQPLVLKDLNLTIEAGWKVGIVGRTGAGKSSLIAVLFRLVNDDSIGGNITIDGIDTKSVRLNELRSRISIIPQEPLLFSSSLRYNLDPFEEYDDAKLDNVLEEVKLANLSLDYEISAGGCNLSAGQRQLICLARAILRNNRILVLDEATANVDTLTDSLIQAKIRQKFATCTVLTIAHRLNTILDSDRVLVMDNGRIVEFGSPRDLLHDRPNGFLSKMIEQTEIDRWQTT